MKSGREMADRLFTEAATRLLLIAIPEGVEVDAESDDWSRLLCRCVTHTIPCVAQDSALPSAQGLQASTSCGESDEC